MPFPCQAPLPKFCFRFTTTPSFSTLHRPPSLPTPPACSRAPSPTTTFSSCSPSYTVARREQQPRLSRTSRPWAAATLHPSPQYSLCTPRRPNCPGGPTLLPSSHDRDSYGHNNTSKHPPNIPRHIFRSTNRPGRLIFSLADDYPPAFLLRSR